MPPPPLQGDLWSDAGQTPLVHNIQRCCQRCHAPLGDHGGSGVGNSRGPWEVDSEPGGVFLCRQLPDCIYAGGKATTEP